MEEGVKAPEVDLTDKKGDNKIKSLLSNFDVKQCLSQPGCCLRAFNLVFYSVLLIVLFRVNETQNRPAVGAVYGVDRVVESVPQPDGTIVGTFGDLGHPIRLNNALCTVDTLWSCVNEGATGVCCDELNNPNSSGPYQSVDRDELFLIGITIPFIFICLRIALMGYLSVGHSTENWRTFTGFYSIDSFIGFGATVIFYWFFIDFCKKYVGCPRPNFYALQFWEEHAVTEDNNLNNSYGSWASGHSCISMAAAVYIVLIIQSDIRAAYSLSMKPIVSAALQSLGHLMCLAIVYGYAFVGFGRIRQYWHHTVDVLSGWAFGAAAAYIAFTYVTKGPYDLNMIKEKRKCALVGEK